MTEWFIALVKYKNHKRKSPKCGLDRGPKNKEKYDECLRLIQELIDCDDFEDNSILREFQDVNELLDRSSADLDSKLAQIGDSIVYKLVKWTKRLPFYQDIPVDIHTNLLTHKWNELLVLTTSVYQSIHGNQRMGTISSDGQTKELHQEVAMNLVTLQTCLTFMMGRSITMDQIRQDMGSMVDKITRVITSFRKFRLCIEEYVCLKVITMVTQEGVVQHPELEPIYDRYMNCLRLFSEQNFPSEPNRVEELLGRLPELQCLGGSGMALELQPRASDLNINQGMLKLTSFLRRLELEKYIPIFEEEDIDFEVLEICEPEALEELLGKIGISLGHIKKIRKAMQEEKRDGSGASHVTDVEVRLAEKYQEILRQTMHADPTMVHEETIISSIKADGYFTNDDAFFGPESRKEYLKITFENGRWQGLKILGDANVPRGKVSFRTMNTLNSKDDITNDTPAQIQVRTVPLDPFGYSWMDGASVRYDRGLDKWFISLDYGGFINSSYFSRVDEAEAINATKNPDHSGCVLS